jgi:hypothetical protein
MNYVAGTPSVPQPLCYNYNKKYYGCNVRHMDSALYITMRE